MAQMDYEDTAQAQRMINLIGGYLGNGLNPAEQKELEAWLALKPENRELFAELTDTRRRERILMNWKPQDAEASLQRIKARRQAVKPMFRWVRVAAAASIVIALSFGGYLLLHRGASQQQTAQQLPDVKPGRNQATLVLGNGQHIVLTKGLSGTLAQQGNMTVGISSGNAVIRTAGNPDASQKVTYLTYYTSMGESSPYPLSLPDGTKVWLNAGSSIVFPSSFNGKTREVKLTGEAYFEVSHRPEQQFAVLSKGQRIEDIGTSFDVKAYDDEPNTQTVLVSGSVRVNNEPLKPGQQSLLGNGQLSISRANIKAATAWRENKFIFDQTDLHTMMREVSRWYDLTVSYTGNVSNDTYDGEIPRNVNLTQMLKILQTSNLHFEITHNNNKTQLTIHP